MASSPTTIPIAMRERLRRALQAAVDRVVGGGSGGSAGTPGGSGGATPPPSPPPPTPGAGATPPPPPPPKPPPGGGGGGATPGGGGGGGATPPGPPPSPPPPPPPPPPKPPPAYEFPGAKPPTGPDDTFTWNGRRYEANAFGQWQRAGPGTWERARGFANSAASTAVGVALGTSLFNLPFAALQQYLEFSKIQTVVAARFREMEEGARSFGTAVGYTQARSAQMALSLGGIQNTYTRESGARLAGFARFMGLGDNPDQVFQSVGRLGELRGNGDVSNAEMALILSRARARGMDRGRIGEFLQRMTGSAEEQFAATGSATLEGTLGVVGLPSLIYGADDPRRTNDNAVAGGLNAVMQSTPGRSFLMRAMGYGRGDISYIDMKKRLDAGVFDSENVTDLFGYMNKLGLNEVQKFQAIESVAGGALKANQIESLVKTFGSAEGIANYRKMVAQSPEEAEEWLRTTLSTYKGKSGKDKSEREAYDGGGVTELGGTRVSVGEFREATIESNMLKIGGKVSVVAEELIEKGGKLIDVVDNLLSFVGQWLPETKGTLDKLDEKLDALNKRLEESTHIQEGLDSDPVLRGLFMQKLGLGTVNTQTGEFTPAVAPRPRR